MLETGWVGTDETSGNVRDVGRVLDTLPTSMVNALPSTLTLTHSVPSGQSYRTGNKWRIQSRERKWR